MVGIIEDVEFKIGRNPDTKEDTGLIELKYNTRGVITTVYFCFDNEAVAKDMKECVNNCLKLEKIKED